MPDNFRTAAIELMAQKQIMTASSNVMAGNPSYARELLATCNQTRRYRRDWLWWRTWACLPAGWPLLTLKIKQAISRSLGGLGVK
jgi:hypothetical protein